MNNTLDKPSSTTVTVKVAGMTCAACASSIESYLKKTDGIHSINVSYPNQSVTFEFESARITLPEIAAKVEEIGYKLVLGDDKASMEKSFEAINAERLKSIRTKLIFAAVFSIPVFILSMFFMGKVPYENWIQLALATPVFFWSGSEFHGVAWKRLMKGSTNMDTLVSLSTSVAYFFSVFSTIFPSYFMENNMHVHVYYESAVVIITLILLGRYLEERAKGKTSSAIKNLMQLRPTHVVVIRNGKDTTIAIDEIQKGDLVVVKPGDKIPVDGKVKKGESFIDESTITGEPIPVEKTKGDPVFAGTINQNGSLRIFAEKVGSETNLSQIIKMVEQAQATKPDVQKLVDKIAGVFVPIVLTIAIGTFFIWYFLGPSPALPYALVTLITVLIIACPCALGLATPTAITVGIGKGAVNGILIKEASSLETIHKIDALILDKTGTITYGKPEVNQMFFEGNNQELWQNVLCSIELSSEHPIARSIANYLKDAGAEKLAIESFENISGKGVTAKYNQHNYAVGNRRLMEEQAISLSEAILKKIEELEAEANTIVIIAEDKSAIGLVGVKDRIKESSPEAIAKLKSLGIDIHLLTGDNEATGQAVASDVGISKVTSNVLPSDKFDYVQNLQSQGKTVGMVGDGINDAAALAQADVGIAMGAGSDIAMESADMTLIHSDLKALPKAVQLSTLTLRTIKQNLFWAFIYNIIAIPVAAGVLYPAYEFLLNPMLAGAAMSFSSISVLLNSLRLKNQKIS